MARHWAREWVFAAAVGLSAVSAHAAVGYDPFPDAASIQATDELEERLWDEAELLRGQFVRGKPTPAVEEMQRLIRDVLKQHWPELASKLKLFVIDQADVLAFTSANGDIFISTGMLMRLDSEEELQVILAREIAHFTHRHTVRTVHAARIGAGAKVIASTALDAADVASKITSGVGVIDLAKSMASLSQDVLITSGRELLQERLNKLKEKLADSFFRSMSVTGIGLVVKSSIFGFKDALEEESDLYAMAFIEQRQGSTDAYRRVMQRLHDESVLDEKKFSIFYANEVRLSERLEALKEFEARRHERSSSSSPMARNLPDAASPTSPEPAPASPKVVSAAASLSTAVQVAPAAEGSVANESVPASAPTRLAAAPLDGDDAQPRPDVVMVLSSVPVVSVVLDEQGATKAESSVSAQAPESSLASGQAMGYQKAMEPFVMPLLESELEAGRYKRLMRNIERSRQGWVLPEGTRTVLAEGYASTGEAVMEEKGQSLAKELLAKHPQDARMWRLLGNLAYRRGQWLDAREHMSQALKFAQAGDERGFIEQKLRQIDKKLSEVSK